MVSPMRTVWNITRRNQRNFLIDPVIVLRGGDEVLSFNGMVEDEIVAVGFRPAELAKGILAKLFYPGEYTIEPDDVVRVVNHDGQIDWRVLSASTGRTFDPHDIAYLVRGSDEQVKVDIRVWRVGPNSDVIEVGVFSVFIVYEQRVARVDEYEGAITRDVQVRLVSREPNIPLQRGDGFMTLDDQVSGQIIDVLNHPARVEARAIVTRGYQLLEF
jgi:hypothetical protein